MCKAVTKLKRSSLPLTCCFKNFGNAKPWHRKEFDYQDSKK